MCHLAGWQTSEFPAAAQAALNSVHRRHPVPFRDVVAARRDLSSTTRTTGATRATGHGRGRWKAAIEGVLAADGPELVFQPVFDLRRAEVVGYETLARFSPWGRGRPAEWFSHAQQEGVAAVLESAILAKALRAAATLPAGRFLTVHLSPDALISAEVGEVLDRQPSLRGLVIELTERHTSTQPREFDRVLDEVRQAGALVAVNDLGSGYAGLRWIQLVNPDIVKLDRRIVSGIHDDASRLAVAEMLGSFANRIDAWLLAEGIEDSDDLDALISIGVPLAQGRLLGIELASWSEGGSEVLDRLRRNARSAARPTMISLVEPVPVAPVGDGDGDGDGDDRSRVLVAPDGTPVGYHLAGIGTFVPEAGVTQIVVGELPAAVLAQAMHREPGRRWQPLVCTGDDGRPLGIVRVDVLAAAIANEAVAQARATTADAG